MDRSIIMLLEGRQVIEVSKDAQILFQGSKPFSLIQLDEAGKGIRILGVSDEQGLKTIKTTDDFTLEVRTEAKALWSMDAVPINPPTEPYDPVPIEIAEEEPMTLHDQIRKMVGQMALERYGASEIETIEEALNFDVDGDGEIGLSGFEVLEDEELIPTPEPAEAVATEETAEEVPTEAPAEEKPAA